MSASYEDTFTVTMELDDAARRVQGLLAGMPRVEVRYARDRRVEARVGTSLRSWGEKITVSLSEAPVGTVLRVRSECSLPLQVLDWGKNYDNVKALGQRL